MNQKTRTLMTMHKAFRLYASRKEGRRGLTSIEDNVDASIWLEDYVEKHGRMIKATTIQTTRG